MKYRTFKQIAFMTLILLGIITILAVQNQSLKAEIENMKV